MVRISRRNAVGMLGSLAGVSAAPSLAASLAATARQTSGPFYPLELPLDSDSDLVQVAGRALPASGTILHLGGRVLDDRGQPIGGARIEIWQCDGFGHYHHPGDRGGGADPDFQGFGATTATADGAYRFRTIVPVSYPGRTPHIHFRIIGRAFEPLTTQMYVAGEPLNARDGLYQRLDERARATVTVALANAPELETTIKRGAKRATFDIVLGPGLAQG